MQAVDLSSCDREPIHILNAVQSFGFLLGLSPDWIVVRASENVSDWLDAEAAMILGQPLDRIMTAEAIHEIRGRLQIHGASGQVERLFGIVLRDGGIGFDVAVHIVDETIVIEAEPSEDDPFNSANVVRMLVARLQQAGDFALFCREAARQMRALTKFDRVMIYRFAPDGSGEVIAESVRGDLAPYLGLHYPASDIPSQARILYERTLLRIIADVDSDPAEILPRLSPEGRPLDLSMSVLRAVSPIHIEYLRNMGVKASLSVSILRNGKLWGLFACHHMEARRLSFERRSGAELFGQIFSWILEGREREVDIAYEATSRELHNRIMSTLASDSASLAGITAMLDELRSIIQSDGVGVCIDGVMNLRGLTPTTEETVGLVRLLNRTASSRVFSTKELGALYEPARDFTERAAGVIAIPISRSPRDYVIFFRQEVARTVTWAGNPEKAVTYGPNGVRLTPRKSFEAWRETVHGQSRDWTEADLRIAESLRITLLEVILRITDSTDKEQKRAQERQELLIAELNHRVRNILNLIRGLVSQSRSDATSVEDFASVVGGRIQALARAHDHITAANWGPRSISELIRLEASAYLGVKADRVLFSGTDVLLDPDAYSTLALVIHEMVTNSAKYGALADSRGSIAVALSRDDREQLVIDWRENGGPAVKPPTRRGFGTTIIERSIPFELKGEAEIHYVLTGVEARFVIPARFVHAVAAAAPAKAAASATGPAKPAGGLSGTVLLVEDNMIIALESEEMLLALGAARVEMASSVGEALRMIDAQAPSFAILDVNLGSETSLAIAERLHALGVTFVFATGYGESFDKPPALRDVATIKKPFDIEALHNAFVAASRSGK